jgi:hypothetical protein
MKKSTNLEDIAGLVLERNERNDEKNGDVEHTHLFHGNIPCHTDSILPPYTSLAPLDRLIDARSCGVRLVYGGSIESV